MTEGCSGGAEVYFQQEMVNVLGMVIMLRMLNILGPRDVERPSIGVQHWVGGHRWDSDCPKDGDYHGDDANSRNGSYPLDCQTQSVLELQSISQNILASKEVIINLDVPQNR